MGIVGSSAFRLSGSDDGIKHVHVHRQETSSVKALSNSAESTDDESDYGRHHHCGTLPYPDPLVALAELMDGNARFARGQTTKPHQDTQRLDDIRQDQRPMAAILGCADSRASTELLFDQGFGDLFSCRVAGNVASPADIASLEYAVAHLGVPVVMVLGHARCGAVAAAVSGKAFPGFIDALLDNITTAVERANILQKDNDTEEERMRCVVVENVLYQTQRVLRSKVVSNAVKKGQLVVVGAYYDLDTRRVDVISS